MAGVATGTAPRSMIAPHLRVVQAVLLLLVVSYCSSSSMM